MEETRKGNQIPTKCRIIPYEESLGQEAIDLYNSCGNELLPWQETLMMHIMAVGEDGLWVHPKFGYAVSRRNGKSEIILARAIWGLFKGERVLYTAHLANTSHLSFEKILDRLDKMGYHEKQELEVYRAVGKEIIELPETKGRIYFRTRSARSGLGENFDTILIDEAQEYSVDQESALKYTVTDAKNPQTILCGTPPTVVSVGTVFKDLRLSTLNSQDDDELSGWAEWGIDHLSDSKDKELWYLTNPSLGYFLTERNIRSELGSDNVDANVQRLGLWLTYNQKSAITKDEWLEYCLKDRPVLPDDYKLFFAVKFSKTGNTVLSVAVKLDDEKVFVESIDCRPTRNGFAWILPYMQGSHASVVVLDGAGEQEVFRNALIDQDIDIYTVLVKTADFVQATALFENKLFSDCICHYGQPALVQSVSNCEHRNVGSSGGFGYCSLVEGIEVGLIESVALAHWASYTFDDIDDEQIITY